MEEIIRVVIREAGYPNGFSIRNVSFSLERGGILLVTGRSGSGKTTLLKSILQIIHLDKGFIRGRIIFKGREINEYTPQTLYREIAYIPQEPWYGILGHTVWLEYCLSLNQSGFKCNMDRLGRYGLQDIIDRTTYNLSAGEYQRLLWASTLDRHVELLLIDEPFVYLDREGRNAFYKLLDEYIDQGGSVIVVDHEYDRWRDLKPKTLLLENGAMKYYGEYRDNLIPSPTSKPRRSRSGGSRYRILYLRNIWHRYPGSTYILRGVDLEAYGGEVIGLTGRNGSGKSTLLRIIAGILKPSRGRIYRYGKPIYVPEEPLLYFTYPTPREELTSGGVEEGLLRRIISSFNLEGILDRELSVLSSGERRRVALASAFIHGYNIFLLDEPSGGLDSYNVDILMDLLDMIASTGDHTIIIASHDERLEPIYTHKYVLDQGVLRREY